MKKTILTFMTILAMATTAKAAFLVPGGSVGDIQYKRNQYSIGGVPVLNFDGTDLTMSGLMNVTGTMDFTGVILVPGADTLPLPCTNRQLAVDTNATSGQRLYVCENGTWVQQGGAGSSSTECSTASCDLNAATTKGGAAIQTGAEDDQPDSDAEVPDNITVNPINATTKAAIESQVELQNMQGAVTDGQVPDTITASNYVPLTGALMTGQLGLSNLGLEFTESDTNPTCGAGNYGLWADLSEQKLKKCENGVSSDIGATAGAGESNTASNVGSQGVGLFKQKSGVDLEFYKLSSANSIISVALSGTDFLQITANEGNINHDNLAGFVANEHIDWTSDQGATNINPANYPITDAEVPDNITVSLYLPLAGGTMTGSLSASNLGIEFIDSDSNPTCGAGEFKIFADLSEQKLKKCMNGSITDLDTTGGTPSFATLTGGTNTSAAMVVGTGSSIAASGSGTVTATNLVSGSSVVSDAEVDDNITVSNYVLKAGDTISGSLSVGTAVTPEASIVLDLSASDKALRVTRLADPAANIATPRHGMIAYDSTDNELQAYIGGSWKDLAASSAGGGGSCWEIDGSGDLQPISGSCSDTLWEIDGSGDLQPKT